MSLANYLSSVMPGPSSRKRSFAEISQSESPSGSPNLSSKRRRISPSPSNHSRSPMPPPSNLYRSYSQRVEGDGLDFRRPIMSTLLQSFEAPPTIDLTADDDSYSQTATSSIAATISRSASSSVGSSTHAATASTVPQRAPPFGRTHPSFTPEVIDLVESDGPETNLRDSLPSNPQNAGPGSTADRLSPDILFMGSRTLHPLVEDARATRRLPTPPVLRNRVSYEGLSHFLQRGGEMLFRTGLGRANERLASIVQDEILDRIDGLPNRPWLNGQRLTAAGDPIIELPDFVEVELNYEQPGFAINRGMPGPPPVDRSSTPPEILEQEPYKAPAQSKPPFSRNLKEEDVAICPCCGDELALGDGDVKQQVWVARQCGHVYCGYCATNRVMSRSGTKKDKANSARPGRIQLRTCMVDGCKKQLGSKTAMVQIYL